MTRRREYDIPIDDDMWVHCVEVGEETAPTVLINVACFMSRDLDRLARHHRLVFVDPRGRGGSAPVTKPEQITADALVDDLEHVRRHLAVERVDVVGWSAGGAAAAAYAMDHPNHVGRVLTIGWLPPRRTPPTDDDRAEALRRAQERAPRAASVLSGDGFDPHDQAARARQAFFSSASYQTPRPELLADMKSTPWAYENEQSDHWRRVLEWSIAGPRRTRGGVLSLPMLVVFGDADRGPLRSARDWVWDHLDTRLLVMAGVGHYPWLEAPEQFFDAVGVFLGGGWPEGAVPVEGRRQDA